jgi:hypothetical protein
MPKKLILVRHGDNERDWSMGKLVPLSTYGRQQIKISSSLIAPHLGDRAIIYHSGLPRAYETACVIQETCADIDIGLIQIPCLDDEGDEGYKRLLGYLFTEYYTPTNLEEDFNPDTKIIVTHAHNPYAMMIKGAIDPSSMTPFSFLNKHPHLTKDDIYRLVLEWDRLQPATEEGIKREAADKTNPHRQHYGGVDIFELPIDRWSHFVSQKKIKHGTLIQSSSPWVPQPQLLYA